MTASLHCSLYPCRPAQHEQTLSTLQEEEETEELRGNMNTEQEQLLLHQMATPLCKMAWWIHTHVSSVVSQRMKWAELQFESLLQL